MNIKRSFRNLKITNPRLDSYLTKSTKGLINNKSILAIIAARKGSKRLSGKNMLDLNGKPLIAWTIEQTLKSKYIDKIVISTDDENIINLSKDYKRVNAPFIRPKELSSDKASTLDVV